MRAFSIMIFLVALVLPSGRASSSPPSDVSAEELQTLHTQAGQGNAKAQYFLGMMYAHGRGVPQDYTTARGWYEKAAAQGYAMAQYNLGALYFYGQGVPQNDVKTYMLWSLAAGRFVGDLQKQAAEYRDKVASRMTSAQLAEAQRLAQRCQAQQFKGC
jgi:TPR repeat protein